MRKISCLMVISLFCLSSIIPVVNSIYVEKRLNDDFIDNEADTYDTFSNDLNIMVVVGRSIKENGENPNDALVRLRASGYPDVITNTLFDGSWQADISFEAWPVGTLFNVTITCDEIWVGYTESVVQGVLTDVGLVILNAITLIAEPDFEESCYLYIDSIQFYGNAYGGKLPYLWSWDFGNGDTSLLQNPIHGYNEGGTYNVCLTVTDNLGKMNTSCVTINLNDTLTADAGGPYTGDICNCIHFSGLYVGGCPPYSFSWDFDNSDGIQVDSTEENPYYYYDTPGVYIASLTISDGRGYIHTNTTSVTISSECIEYSPWPMSCHDIHHTSRSSYSTADNPGGEKWRFQTKGPVESGMVIDKDGVIYFGAHSNNLYAVYPDGSLKWKHNIGQWITSTPALAKDGTVYIGSWDDYMYAINSDGTRKWRYCSRSSITSSPAIGNDGVIYFGNMGWPDGNGCKIFALYPNGTLKWEYQAEDAVLSDPAIGDDGTVYIGSWDKYFYALNSDGTLKWRFKTGDHVKSHPSIAEDGTIYFSSFDDYLYALNPDGTLKWKYSGSYGGASSTALGLDGTIFVAGKNSLLAINPDGTKKWSCPLGSNIAHSSPVIDANGIIYTGVNAGRIIGINPDGTERWRKKIGNYGVYSQLCIGEDGAVYIGSSCNSEYTGSFGYLHCFTPQENNHPPATPVIGGKTSWGVNQEIHVTIECSDPDNNPLSYYVDWGDDTFTDWKYDIPYIVTDFDTWSGAEHTYSSSGFYNIRIKARDDFGGESDWGAFRVTISKNKAVYINLVLQRLIQYFPLFEKILNQII